jgi:type I restriction enzyme S subunit
MSRFEKLVKQLCPDGVPFRALSDLVDYEQPGEYLVASKSYDDSYSTPVLTAGQTFVLGYTNETDGIYQASPERPILIFDDFTTAFKWVDFPFKAKSSAMKMLTSKANGPASLRYIYYAMQTIKYKPQDHARQWIGIYSQFRIPVPPIDVQLEIVRILNMFHSLDKELKAELKARRTQYAHYRDLLFSFASDAKVPWPQMGEVGVFFRGRRFTKEDFVPDGIASIHYGEIYTSYGIYADATFSQVRPEMAPGLRFAATGDVIIAAVGETVEDVGKAVAWLGDGDVAIHDDCFAFRHSLNSKYVAYYFQTARFHSQKNKYVARAKVKRISGESLGQIRIPVPSRKKQDRIVKILDKFDMLLNDRLIGLPAEISLRQTQYEHYRDRLLTFEEAAV